MNGAWGAGAEQMGQQTTSGPRPGLSVGSQRSQNEALCRGPPDLSLLPVLSPSTTAFTLLGHASLFPLPDTPCS